MRDVHRRRVDAAIGAWREHGLVKVTTQLDEMDLAVARDHVLRLTRSAWFRRRWPEVAGTWPTGVVLRAHVLDEVRASVTDGIVVPAWQLPMHKVELLRLVAHAVTGPVHDWRWGKVMVQLMVHEYGRTVAALLRAELARRRVPHRKPKQLSPEAIAKLRAHASQVFQTVRPAR